MGDDQDSLDLMQEMLAPYDYEVVCAASGPEAVRLLRHSAPDLVILDIMMPDMNGFAVLDVMRSMPAFKDTPVIFQTAFPSQEHGRRPRVGLVPVDAGESFMLCKPLNADFFVKAVEHCLCTRSGGGKRVPGKATTAGSARGPR